ncbi:calcitonin [Platysternon megacephalum]|uniref:Calcitonin n=1 Tax=Platysternon megacephalum TaxID=55544 RepID=A0A4D9EDD0_9SAUR|nr:calcitonin [Platysternon megacephalum]
MNTSNFHLSYETFTPIENLTVKFGWIFFFFSGPLCHHVLIQPSCSKRDLHTSHTIRINFLMEGGAVYCLFTLMAHNLQWVFLTPLDYWKQSRPFVLAVAKYHLL